MNRIAKYLNQHIEGAVYSSPLVLTAYATDGSVLKMYPRVVAIPENTDDVRRLVRFSNQLAIKGVSLPVTVRGTGMDETGAAIGSGLVISLEKMNKIQEIDPRQRLVRLQAGVKLGELQAALALHGLILPLSGHPDLTIGGMIANHFSGSSSEKYGSIANYVSQAEVVLSNGDVIQTAVLSQRNLARKKGLTTFEGEIYRKLDTLIDENEKKLAAIPDPKTNLSGYPFIAKLRRKNGAFDLLPAFYGAQGTLGIVTEVIVSCELMRERPQYVALLATDIKHALRLVTEVTELKPMELNLYDLVLFKEAGDGSKLLKIFKKLPENGVLMMASFDDVRKRRRMKKVKQLIKKFNGRVRFAASNDDNYGDFNELKSILSVYLNDGFRSVRVPLVDDAYIPRERLTDYYELVQMLGDKYKIKLPVFGSAMTGYYSVRPKVDLSSVPGRQFALAFVRDYSKTVAFCKGSLAAGAPEGRLKAVFTNHVMDAQLAELYAEVKKIFDQYGIMNPGVKGEATLPAVVRRLRTSYNQGLVHE
jgi:FAD/FMN-containing dehydrogenase